MRVWLFLLGGMLVWALHFGAVYGAASLGEVLAQAQHPLALAAVGLITLGCLAVDAWLVLLAWRGKGPGVARETNPDMAGFVRLVAGGGAALSFIAVLWQGLPALFDL